MLKLTIIIILAVNHVMLHDRTFVFSQPVRWFSFAALEHARPCSAPSFLLCCRQCSVWWQNANSKVKRTSSGFVCLPLLYLHRIAVRIRVVLTMKPDLSKAIQQYPGVKVVLNSCWYYHDLHHYVLFNSPRLNASLKKCFNILIPVERN